MWKIPTKEFRLLRPVLFSDSEIAKKIDCGRTKAAAIAQSVLGPYSESLLVDELKNAEYFSIASDATSKGKNLVEFQLQLTIML